MKWYSMAAGSAVLIGALAGCGGGGGGSGGGGFPLLPIPAAALTVTVQINGAAATASNGQYSIKAGDKVTVTPSQSADWSSSSAPSGSNTLSGLDVSGTKWSAQIVNNTSAASVLTLSAKATGNAALTIDTVFNVGAGDARNGSYKVYSSNGSRDTLALNFDTLTYVMTDENGAAKSNSFAAFDAEPGTYLFYSPLSPTNVINSRFRLTGDTVVGAFPFHTAKTTTTFQNQPFIASRALVTTQTALDGTYNRLGINMQVNSRQSQMVQTQISGGGTLLQQCVDNIIYSVADCPSGSLATYSVSPGPTADTWSIVNLADASQAGTFAIARVNGKNVYLGAGVNVAAPSDAVFRVGLTASTTWPVTKASAGDTAGTWGTLDFDATNYTTVQIRSDATSNAFSAVLDAPATSVPGIRSFSNNGQGYRAVQDGTLSVVVGANSGATAGYMQIGLVK